MDDVRVLHLLQQLDLVEALVALLGAHLKDLDRLQCNWKAVTPAGGFVDDRKLAAPEQCQLALASAVQVRKRLLADRFKGVGEHVEERSWLVLNDGWGDNARERFLLPGVLECILDPTCIYA